MRALEPLSTSPLLSPKVLIFEEDQAIRAALVEGLKNAQLRVYEVSSLASMESRIQGQYFELMIIGHVDEFAQALHRKEQVAIHDHLHMWSEASALLVCLHSQSDHESIHQNQEKLGLSKSHWEHLLRSSELTTESYTLLARPRPLEIISQISLLAHETLSQTQTPHDIESATSPPKYERLVLWAGPKDHPLVRELQRACESLYLID